MQRMRSWLFAPGDSEKKMTKAADGAADVVLLDLEDSVAPESKPAARELVHESGAMEIRPVQFFHPGNQSQAGNPSK